MVWKQAERLTANSWSHLSTGNVSIGETNCIPEKQILKLKHWILISDRVLKFVEPLKEGHFGTNPFALYRNAVFSLKV